MNDREKVDKAGEYYIVNENWLSDLVFYENEIFFFAEVLKKDFILSPDIKTDDALHELKLELEPLKQLLQNVNDDIHENMKVLRQALQKSYPPNLEAISTEHEKLSLKVTNYIYRIKSFKVRLFQISRGSHVSAEALLTA